MAIDVAEYTRLKRKTDALRAEADRAKGAYDADLRRLKQEFGCDSLKAARAKLKELEEESETADEGYEQAMAAFKDEWGEVLG